MKKNKHLNNILFLFSFLQFLFITVKSQNTTEIENHKKYWYYKTRFNNDFVSIGTGDGQSIPFNQRGFNDSYTYTAPTQILKTGDGTVQLGIYVGVLATEYRLLKDKGQDVTQVKHELFCALNAINRLDFMAEFHIGNYPHPGNPHTTSSGILNGFFMRDDVPSDFAKNHYKELNYYNDDLGNPNYQNIDANDQAIGISGDRGFTQLNSTGVFTVQSGFQSFMGPYGNKGWNDVPFPNKAQGHLSHMEESQDQLYYLLMGTALVSKLVDDETDGSSVFGYGSGETSLKTEAINISDRLIKHVKNSPGGLWTIHDPANANNLVQIGSNALPFAYALDNAGCFIKYNQDLPSFNLDLINPFIHNSCTDYRNVASFTPTLWETFVQLDGGPTVDSQGFYHAMSAICNCTFEKKGFLDLAIQAAINAAQAAITNVIANLNQVLDYLQNQIDKLPRWAQNLLQGLLNAMNAAQTYASYVIDTLIALISSLTSQLMPTYSFNTTEERLLYNNYFNIINYFACNGDPFAYAKIGSDAYFGIFLNRVLHPNPTPLPSNLQLLTQSISPIAYPIAKQDLLSILNSAPCEGNYNFYPNNRPGTDWGNPNRVDRMDPTYRYNTACPTAFVGEYHGLDYMLLHNLYYLTEGSSSFFDYSKRTVTATFPIGADFTTTNRKTIGGYEYIIGKNIINSNGGSDYRAGKEIALLPNGNSGFNSALGSDFSAVISPYVCSSNMQRVSSSSQSQAESYDKDTESKTKAVQTKAITQTQQVTETYEGLNSEQSEMISNLTKQLDSLLKIPNYNFQTLYSKIVVYPNPNNGIFNISFELTNEDNINLEIIDAVGREVYASKHIVGSFVLPIDFTHLSKGVYLAKFINLNGEMITQKITIN